MRKLGTLAIAVIALVAAAAPEASPDPSARRKDVGARISVSVFPGWDLVHRSLTHVVDPIPRLAVASFAVRLSARQCDCGLPSVEDFPRAGALLFLWEYPHLPRRTLMRFPRRPGHFRMGSEAPQRHVCQGPSDEIVFQQAGRAFQAEIYLGPAAGRGVRAKLLATIDSLRVGQRALGTLPGPGSRQ